MTFFSAEDFNLITWATDYEKERMAIAANKKLQREAKVVYGWPVNSTINNDKLWSFHKEAYDDVATHRALLICVEEIVKPKCEHAGHIIAVGKGIFRCADCKSEIKPTGLEVVE